MRGEKTIDLGYEIAYSKGGKFHTATTITVRAPGYELYRVHSMMQGWTSEGAVGYRKTFAEQIAKAETGEVPAPQAGEEPAEDVKIDVMAMMAAGLTPARYAEFAAYVMDTLKNNAKLCSVGDDPSATLTDHVLRQIVENGGLADVDRIFSEFAGFFMLGQGSKAKPSGPASSTSSASLTEEVSPTPKRVNSRLRG